MGRYGRRISRSLIAALVVTIVLGLVSYLKRPDTTRAAESPEPAPPAQATVAPPVTTPQPLPAIVEPAPRPVEIALVEPSTKPANNTSPNPAGSSNTTPATVAPQKFDPITTAQAKKDAGDLLTARTMLNDALLSRQLNPADTESAKKLMADINQTVVFSPKRFAEDSFGGTYSVQNGDVLQKIAPKFDVTGDLLMRLNGITDPKKLRAGQTIKILHGPFNAVVYKGKFRMDIYLGPADQKGGMYVSSYSVGLGKDDSTPTGTWQVESGKKIKNPTYYSPRGEGVVAADDPKNPLGERWIGLAGIDGQALGKSSYGIHGTIDESSVGKQESMGCIRMHNADVELVFDLLVDGKSVVVVRD